MAHEAPRRAACYFGLGLALLKAIAVNLRIASEREGIGRCFARHSSMPATYSADTRMRIVRSLGSVVGRTIIDVIPVL